jgi:hypothetical protein
MYPLFRVSKSIYFFNILDKMSAIYVLWYWFCMFEQPISKITKVGSHEEEVEKCRLRYVIKCRPTNIFKKCTIVLFSKIIYFLVREL